MKLTYLMWGYSHDSSIIKAFEEAGVVVRAVLLPWETARELFGAWEGRDSMLSEDIVEQIRKTAGDIVFTVNFSARLSNFCQTEKIPYCSWILQLPNFDLYTAAVKNPCNYLGICDSYLVGRLCRLGVEKAFLLPDAVEVGEDCGKEPVEKGVCFIGRCPNDSLNIEKITKYSQGYLEALLHSQRVCYGASLLEDGMLSRVQQEVMENNPVPSGILAEMQKLFIADRYLAPKCSRMQQDIFLYNAASAMKIYSDGEFADCEAEKLPFVEEEERRMEIYAEKEFTLVLSPYTLHDGIPRQTLEVIAAGGFPVVGFVKDYAYFFKKDETLAYFMNASQFARKLERFGNDHEERERVRKAAFRLVQEAHTYRHRIAMMMEMWEKL